MYQIGNEQSRTLRKKNIDQLINELFIYVLVERNFDLTKYMPLKIEQKP